MLVNELEHRDTTIHTFFWYFSNVENYAPFSLGLVGRASLLDPDIQSLFLQIPEMSIHFVSYRQICPNVLHWTPFKGDRIFSGSLYLLSLCISEQIELPLFLSGWQNKHSSKVWIWFICCWTGWSLIAWIYYSFFRCFLVLGVLIGGFGVKLLLQQENIQWTEVPGINAKQMLYNCLALVGLQFTTFDLSWLVIRTILVCHSPSLNWR